MNTWYIYTAPMSPTHSGSTVLQHFKCGNAIEICNRIMFNFYPGLPHGKLPGTPFPCSLFWLSLPHTIRPFHHLFYPDITHVRRGTNTRLFPYHKWGRVKRRTGYESIDSVATYLMIVTHTISQTLWEDFVLGGFVCFNCAHRTMSGAVGAIVHQHFWYFRTTGCTVAWGLWD